MTKSEQDKEYNAMLSAFNNIRKINPNMLIYGCLRFTVENNCFYETNVERLFLHALEVFKADNVLTGLQKQAMFTDLIKHNFEKREKPAFKQKSSRFDSSGNLGLNASSPSAKLDVDGAKRRQLN